MNFGIISAALGLSVFPLFTAVAPAYAGCNFAGCYSHSHVVYNQYPLSPYLNIASHIPYAVPANYGPRVLTKRVKTTRTLYRPVTQIVPIQSWAYQTTYQPVAKTVVRHGRGASQRIMVYPPAVYPAPYGAPGLAPAAFAPHYPAQIPTTPLYPAQMIYGY